MTDRPGEMWQFVLIDSVVTVDDGAFVVFCLQSVSRLLTLGFFLWIDVYFISTFHLFLSTLNLEAEGQVVEWRLVSC